MRRSERNLHWKRGQSKIRGQRGRGCQSRRAVLPLFSLSARRCGKCDSALNENINPLLRRILLFQPAIPRDRFAEWIAHVRERSSRPMSSPRAVVLSEARNDRERGNFANGFRSRRHKRLFCGHCEDERRCSKRVVDHRVHLALTVCTVGGWTAIWCALILRSFFSPWRCTFCGARCLNDAIRAGSRNPSAGFPV